MKYKTVLLDADETLYDFKRAERESLTEALLSFSVVADGEMIHSYSEINDVYWKMLERGETTKGELQYKRFESFFEKWGLNIDAHLMADRYMEGLSQKGYLLDGAQKLCTDLADKVDLYIVTNGTAYVQERRFQNSPIKNCFRGIFVSDRIGYDKPQREFFDYVARHIDGFSKEGTVIVGDSLSSDMAGGIAYGIDTCLYNPSEKNLAPEIAQKITHIAKSHSEIYDFLMGDRL